ncbi:MAG TPA: T9SS type A sorting domain-containing protein [Flavobacteriales bacterium]
MFVNGVEDTELAGMTFVSTSGDLYMEMISNDTISCAEVGGFRTPWEWAWTVTSGIDATGIGGEDAVQFVLYPNPASVGSPVRLCGPAHTSMDIRVLDVTGRTVHHLRPTRSEGGPIDLDLSGLGSGQYSVVLSTPARVGVSKLQIVH